jgi:oligoribonuclease (3'-5' exoribonuclease)
VQLHFDVYFIMSHVYENKNVLFYQLMDLTGVKRFVCSRWSLKLLSIPNLNTTYRPVSQR